MANGLEGRNFSRLLQESRQLNARIRAGGHDNVFLPQLQRGLEQIEEHSSQLAAKVASTSELCPGVESKAALFLASKGYDVSNVGARLRKVADIIPGPTSQAAVTFDLDVDSFIQGELDNTVLNMLNRIDQMAIAEAEVIIAERRMNSWDDSKGRVCESLRIQQKGQDYITGKGSAPTGPKVSVYSKVVQALNEARLRGSSLCLPRRFEGALRELEGSDPRGETLIDCWRALQSILGSDEDDNVFEVKDFRSSYLADPKSAESKLWKAQLVGGSRKHLEEMYLRFVDRTLAQYPRDALLGGRPSAVERIRAFCDIKLKRLSPAELSSVEIMDGIALWMILFTLVRCGLLKDALSMAQSMEHVIQRSDPLFFSFLRAFVTSPSNQ